MMRTIKKRARRAHFSIHAVAAIGGALAALLFVLCWAIVWAIGTPDDIYVQLLTSVEMSSGAALIQGSAVSFAIGSFAGAAVAWISNRLGLLIEPE